MSRRTVLLIAAVLLTLTVTGCASPNEAASDGAGGPGFWGGVWDGLTASLAFFGNLVGLGDWGIYETQNAGGWYDFGFLLGIGSFAGSATGTTQAARRR